MIVCVSPASVHYDETHNTLQYANRAKEIKTKAIRNVISVDRHVAQYCQQIMEQAQQIERLKAELASKGAASALEDRAEEERTVSQAVSRLHGSWESGKAKRVAAERAGAERTVVDAVIRTLQSWQLTALSTVDVGSPAGGSSSAAAASTTALLQTECADLLSSLSAKSPYLRAVTAAKATLHSRSSALSSFTYEARLLDSRADTAASDARQQGAQSGFAVQAHAMRKMLEARVKVGVALDSALENGSEAVRALGRLASGVDKANNEAFAAFAGESSTSTAFSLPTGSKRDAGTRSPLVPENPSWDKVPRLGLAGLGSAPSGSYAPQPIAPSPMRARRSPRKGVSFHSSARRAASPGKKGKGVQWRDELGDGYELEDVKYGSPDVSMLGETSFPSIAVTSPPSVASSRMWTASSSFAPGSESSKAAEMMAQKARTASGSSLRGGKLSSTPSLSSVSESTAPFSFLPSPDSTSSAPSRAPFSDLPSNSSFAAGESSFSMAPTSSGLIAPLVASLKASSLFPTASSFTNGPPPTPGTPSSRRGARRASHIGPLRSAKSSRRSSLAVPLPPPAASASFSSHYNAGDSSFASSAGAGNMSISSSNPIPLRKPGRVGGASIAASAAAAPPSKSPRKHLPSHARGGASRRLSTLPSAAPFGGSGRLSGGGAGSTTPAPVPFGQKSAARIAARRASSLTGTGASSGNNSGSGAAALGLPTTSSGGSRKESTGGVWR
jgi:kinesin family protein 18/19